MTPRFLWAGWYFERDGVPVPAEEFPGDYGRWWNDFDASRRIALYAEGGVRVSTVFIGLNHGYKPGEVVCYETLAEGGPFGDEDMRRYSTRAEAERGHAEMVAAAKDWAASATTAKKDTE